MYSELHCAQHGREGHVLVQRFSLAALWQDFAECGELVSCRCLKNEAGFGISGILAWEPSAEQDGQLRGIAFVEFKDDEVRGTCFLFGRAVVASAACRKAPRL